MNTEILSNFFNTALPLLDEKSRRIVTGSMSISLGYGGISFVHRCSNVTRNTINKGVQEIKNLEMKKILTPIEDFMSQLELDPNFNVKNKTDYEINRAKINHLVSKLISLYEDEEKNKKEINEIILKLAYIYNHSKVSDGKLFIKKDEKKSKNRNYKRNFNSILRYKNIIKKVYEIVKNDIYGNPEEVILYTTWSLRSIKEELRKSNINVCINVIAKILVILGFSLQQNRKLIQVGEPNPLRDWQFDQIKADQEYCKDNNIPAISIDSKASFCLGLYYNNGTEYAPTNCPREVNDHDFPSEEKVKLFGIYSFFDNMDFSTLNMSHDTPDFAYSCLNNFWRLFGKDMYQDAKELHIYSDCGGSNGIRLWLWKYNLQKFANEHNLKLRIMYYPQGTSKWNKIEHRYFSQISRNWRGKPLTTLKIVKNLINSTTTSTGLLSYCMIDEQHYSTGIKINNKDKKCINLKYDDEKVKWNFTIEPNNHTL